ncbi:hypothetical protein HN358_03180 [Candidatus Uhrbacteria bacterium]|jgi:HTH-type transcriptional regulator, sugar sensing transcriptional regulator|nr:hypothetical protein [Candidatus Uhrbacteria bacterium]MBT7717202.1 hypothetical protein [Candidatus Uhrbacteria bacterium]
MEHIIHALQQLGLSDNAQKVYLHNFKTGRATIGELAKQLLMDRSSTYLAVEQLADKGLIAEDVIDGKKHVWAYHPEVLEAVLEKHSKQFTKLADNIDKNLGSLLIDYRTNNKDVALQSFSGRSSLPRITQDILSSNTSEVRIITNQNAERKVFSANEHDNFISTRLKKGIKAFVLAADTKGASLLKRYDKRELRETKILKELKPFKNEVYIYDDKVAVLGFTSTTFGFIVHDTEFSELQKLLFDNLFSKK